MPDLRALMEKHSDIYDILYSDDSIHIVFRDKADTKDILNKFKLYIKVKSHLKLSEFIIKEKQFFSCYSTRHRRKIYALLGLEKLALVTYELKSLSHSSKTLFGYALKGRGKERGLLGELHGSIIGRNSIAVPERALNRLKEFIEYWKITYKIREIYVDIQQKRRKK